MNGWLTEEWSPGKYVKAMRNEAAHTVPVGTCIHCQPPLRIVQGFR